MTSAIPLSLHSDVANAIVVEADGLFCSRADKAVAAEDAEKIDQSMPIVAGTDPILNRRNFLLNSRAQISDGSGGRFVVVCKNDLR